MTQGVREQELRLTQEEAPKFVIFPSSPPLHYLKSVAPPDTSPNHTAFCLLFCAFLIFLRITLELHKYLVK